MTFLSRLLALAVGLYLGYMLLQEDHFSRNDLFRGVITGILLLYGIRGNHLLTGGQVRLSP